MPTLIQLTVGFTQLVFPASACDLPLICGQELRPLVQASGATTSCSVHALATRWVGVGLLSLLLQGLVNSDSVALHSF